MYNHQEKEALYAWINQMEPFKSEDELFSAEPLFAIARRIHNFAIREPQPNNNNWETIYLRIKSLYRDLERFYAEEMSKKLIYNVDVLKLAQKKDSIELYRLCTLILGATIGSANSQQFINVIVNLNQAHQAQIMKIITQNNFLEQPPAVVNEELIKELLSKIETLEADNQKMDKILFDYSTQIRELTTANHELQERNAKLNEELQSLFGKDMSILDVSDITNHEQQTNELINQQIIEDLKQKLYEQQNNHQIELRRLNEQIQFLQQKIIKRQRNIEESVQRPISQVKQHPPCISLVKHKEIMLKQSDRIAKLTQAQYVSNHQIIKLNNKMASMSKEIQKLQQEITRKTENIQQNDYQILQMKILSSLNTSLKSRFLSKNSK